jgi:hypothetical protein
MPSRSSHGLRAYPFLSAPAYSVFQTYEIVENILLHLVDPYSHVKHKENKGGFKEIRKQMKQLIVAKRVCQHWNEIIESSSRILSLLGMPSKNKLLLLQENDETTDTPPDSPRSLSNIYVDRDICQNPLLFDENGKLCTEYILAAAWIVQRLGNMNLGPITRSYRHLKGYLNPEASWRRLKLTIPDGIVCMSYRENGFSLLPSHSGSPTMQTFITTILNNHDSTFHDWDLPPKFFRQYNSYSYSGPILDYSNVLLSQGGYVLHRHT